MNVLKDCKDLGCSIYSMTLEPNRKSVVAADKWQYDFVLLVPAKCGGQHAPSENTTYRYCLF